MSDPTIRRRPRPVIAPARASTTQASTTSSGNHLDADDSYEVGYRKPPRDTRFGGPRGNRSGRKKGVKTFSSALERELKSKVAVNIGGKVRQITKLEAYATNLVNSGISGKPQAQRMLATLLIAMAEKDAAKLVAQPESDGTVELGTGEADALALLNSMFNPDTLVAGDQP